MKEQRLDAECDLRAGVGDLSRLPSDRGFAADAGFLPMGGTRRRLSHLKRSRKESVTALRVRALVSRTRILAKWV